MRLQDLCLMAMARIGHFKMFVHRYEDDKDEGEWFLYTGSGGRDLSGNKRVTNVSCFLLESQGRLIDT